MYQRISGLTPAEIGMASNELEALAQVWSQQRLNLQLSDEIERFLQRLKTEWAIETGLIERLYQWDRGVTEVLIKEGIDACIIAHRAGLDEAKAKKAKQLVDDQYSALEGLFGFVKAELPLSEHFIRSVHGELTQHQDSVDAVDAQGRRIQVPFLRGTYKTQPNNPRRSDGTAFEYCPPERVVDEMKRLVALYLEYEPSCSPEVLSAWLHHRFTQIHPFQDGNGRVARILATMVFLRHGLFPLVVRDSERDGYIDALERADSGNLGPLIVFFTKNQRQSLLKALGLQQEVERLDRAQDIVQLGLQRLRAKAVSQHEVIRAKASLAFQALQRRLEAFAESIQTQLDSLGQAATAKFTCEPAFGQRSHYFRRQIIETVKKFDYFANLDTYAAWLRIAIKTELNFELVFSIHGLGAGSNGTMMVIGFGAIRTINESGASEVGDCEPACIEPYQFNYADSDDQIVARLDTWVEQSLSMGMAHWYRTLS